MPLLQIKSITRSASSTRDDLEFEYDAAGNRIVKIVKPRPGGSPSTQDQWKYTYYVRDAQGNVMAAYDREFAYVSGTLYLDHYSLSELDIYGSARLGQFYNRNISLFPIIDLPSTTFSATLSGLLFSYSGGHTANLFTADASHYERYLGYKKYEISNHLGNVIAVISDRKTGVDNTGDNVNDYYLPDVLNSQDYYTFGATMPGRGLVGSSGYRYGFNGKENDNEVKGEGNSIDFGARIYDSRLGRFFSTDPQEADYPFQSTYVFAQNNPIALIDVNGEGVPGTKDNRASEGQKDNCNGTVYSCGTSEKQYKDEGWVKSDDYEKKLKDFIADHYEESHPHVYDKNKDFSNTFIDPNNNQLSPDLFILHDELYPKVVSEIERSRNDGIEPANLGLYLLPMPPVFQGAKILGGGTFFYRAMSFAEYEGLLASGELTSMAGKELFVSTSASYSRSYLAKRTGYDVLVRFSVESGTINRIATIGVRNGSRAIVDGGFGYLPKVSAGWMERGLNFFKGEQGIINIGLGNNPAIFNSAIKGFKVIR